MHAWFVFSVGCLGFVLGGLAGAASAAEPVKVNQQAIPTAPAPSAASTTDIPLAPPNSVLKSIEPIIGNLEFEQSIPPLTVDQDPSLNQPLERY